MGSKTGKAEEMCRDQKAKPLFASDMVMYTEHKMASPNEFIRIKSC